MTNSSIEDEIANYESQIEKYMQQSLDSTGRSVQQLENSEKLADSTARVKFLLIHFFVDIFQNLGFIGTT